MPDINKKINDKEEAILNILNKINESSNKIKNLEDSLNINNKKIDSLNVLRGIKSNKLDKVNNKLDSVNNEIKKAEQDYNNNLKGIFDGTLTSMGIPAQAYVGTALLHNINSSAYKGAAKLWFSNVRNLKKPSMFIIKNTSKFGNKTANMINSFNPSINNVYKLDAASDAIDLGNKIMNKKIEKTDFLKLPVNRTLSSVERLTNL